MGCGMIKIKDATQYDCCLSCGREGTELLRVFNIGRNEHSFCEVTLCTECLGEPVKSEILYQPKEGGK